MFIQGNLQQVFDALFKMGVIDPVLEMDWEVIDNEITQNPEILDEALKLANECQDDLEELITKLKELDQKKLTFLAVEVAREFAEYETRQVLH
jgi:hypothetical protein